MAIQRTTRTVPVINGGGSVHVNYTESDVKSITINGTERAEPDANGNINIVVPERIDVTDTVDMGEQDAVPTGAAVASAIAEAINGEAAARSAEDDRLTSQLISLEITNELVQKHLGVNFITAADFTRNGYLNASGELKPHADYKATDYIDVTGAKSASGDFTALVAAHYICYDENKTLIMSYHHDGVGPVNLPAGTAYIRFCHDFTQGEPSITIDSSDDADAGTDSEIPVDNSAVAAKIHQLEVTDRAILASIGAKLVCAADFTLNGYLNYQGELKPHADYKATDYIDVTEAKSASGDFTALVSAHYICYDEDKALIMAYHHEGEGLVNLPDGTAYIRFCHDFTQGEPSITIKTGSGVAVNPVLGVDTELDIASGNPIANSAVASKFAELESAVMATLGVINVTAADFALNGYLNASGELKPHADYKATDYIDVTGAESASGDFTALVSAHYICYTEGKALIMAYHHQGEGPVNLPAGTAYIRFCHDFTRGEPSITIDKGQGATASTDISPKLTYRTQVRRPLTFVGKRAVFVGDSITKGYVNGSTIIEDGWPKLFSEAAGMEFTNIAVGGASFLDGVVADNILVQVTRADKTADFIFIAAGVNDWQLDLSYDDFKARVEAVCDYLNANYTGQVVWITPIAAPRALMATQPTRSLQRYRDIITETVLRKDTLGRFSVVQGTDLNFPDTYGTDQCSALFGDGLHPSSAGYHQYAAALMSILRIAPRRIVYQPFDDEAELLYRDGYRRGKDPYPVIIICGEANADGRAPKETAPAWFADAGFKVRSYKMWDNNAEIFANYSVDENNGCDDNSTVGTFSFDPFFAKRYIERFSNSLYAIRQSREGISMGGQPIHSGQYNWTWQPRIRDIVDGCWPMCLGLMDKWLVAQDWAKEQNRTLLPIAVLWMQGEADAEQGYADEYRRNLINVVAWIRGLFNNPTLPFIAAYIPPNDEDPEASAKINRAIESLVPIDPYYATVNMEGHYTTYGDSTYYDADALQYLGEKMFEKLIEMNDQ